MFIDSEKDILKQYIYNERGFDDGISNFELFVLNNLNNIDIIEKEYKYNRKDESEYLYTVYERIILYMVNIYFNPAHKIDRRFLKTSEIYLSYCIDRYFDYIYRYRIDRELNHYYKDIYTLNEVGITAQKIYLASVLCLSKNGLRADNDIEDIKERIRNNN